MVFIETPGYKDEILGGSVTLRDDGRYTDETLYRETRGEVVTQRTITLRGWWFQRGDALRFEPDRGVGRPRPYVMRVDGTRLTLVDIGVTSVFER